jgi:hypothetical protein
LQRTPQGRRTQEGFLGGAAGASRSLTQLVELRDRSSLSAQSCSTADVASSLSRSNTGTVTTVMFSSFVFDETQPLTTVFDE